MAQIPAFCLMTPSRYVNQCWLQIFDININVILDMLHNSYYSYKKHMALIWRVIYAELIEKLSV